MIIAISREWRFWLNFHITKPFREKLSSPCCCLMALCIMLRSHHNGGHHKWFSGPDMTHNNKSTHEKGWENEDLVSHRDQIWMESSCDQINFYLLCVASLWVISCRALNIISMNITIKQFVNHFFVQLRRLNRGLVQWEHLSEKRCEQLDICCCKICFQFNSWTNSTKKRLRFSAARFFKHRLRESTVKTSKSYINYKYQISSSKPIFTQHSNLLLKA
jgi:hypothetical protein